MPDGGLEARVAACGAAPETVEMAPQYAAETALAGARGTLLELAAAVEAGAEGHGEHAVASPEVLVVRAGEVVGVVVAERWEQTGVRDGDLELDVRACSEQGGGASAALSDGAVELWTAGRLEPLDHVHVQAETWSAAPLAVEVSGGAFES